MDHAIRQAKVHSPMTPYMSTRKSEFADATDDELSDSLQAELEFEPRLNHVQSAESARRLAPAKWKTSAENE